MTIMAELTVPTKGPSFVATRAGKCKLCPDKEDNKIRADVDFICEVRRFGHVHTHCADRYIRTLEEHGVEGGEGQGGDE